MRQTIGRTKPTTTLQTVPVSTTKRHPLPYSLSQQGHPQAGMRLLIITARPKSLSFQQISLGPMIPTHSPIHFYPVSLLAATTASPTYLPFQPDSRQPADHRLLLPTGLGRRDQRIKKALRSTTQMKAKATMGSCARTGGSLLRLRGRGQG